MTDHLRKRSDASLQWRGSRSWGKWVYAALLCVGGALVIFYTPFARMLGFERLDRQAGSDG
jgi:hypothetical protein